MQTKIHTPWKKSRKFGDVFGGRVRPRCVDNIFNRQHNLQPPRDNEPRPLFIADNPSKDFYFPVTPDEIRAVLANLPREHTAHLTHVWLQKIKRADYEHGDTFQGSFICGSGVYLIVLHPFPTDNRMRLGTDKPTRKVLNYYRQYTTDLRLENDVWYLQWTAGTIKQYYLTDLLLHEIGHSIDSFYKRYWSKNQEKKRENFADSYVALWTNKARESFQ